MAHGNLRRRSALAGPGGTCQPRIFFRGVGAPERPGRGVEAAPDRPRPCLPLRR
jgi:hypothetical protein